MRRAAVRAHGSGVYDRQADAAVREGGKQGRQAVDGECFSYHLQFEWDEGRPDAGLMEQAGWFLERSKVGTGGGGEAWELAN